MLIQTNNKLYHLARALRPRQWIKNLSLYAAITFGGSLFDIDNFITATLAFTIFCAVSSGMYLINDIHDAPKDKLHPIKKGRPIPSGKLPVSLAILTTILLLSTSLILSLFLVNFYFFVICLMYIFIQLLYTFKVRNVIILDALVVALGFIFRVIAGGVATAVSISSWLILATIGLSLLLAFGKRRAERTILGAQGMEMETRKTLKYYPDSLLDSMISMSASFAIITYSLFTFQTSPQKTAGIFQQYLPATFAQPKWMMLTIPVVIYGVARYLYVIYEKKEAESPERALLEDKPLLSTVVLWGISIIFLFYFL